MSRPIPVDPDKWAEMVQALAEVAKLRQKVNNLEARCRVLRRAGDEMAEALDDGEPNRLIDDWWDAKQGM